MKAKDLITYSLPHLTPDDTGKRALELMDEYRVSHLPLVDKGKYIALVSDELIYDQQLEDQKLNNLKITGFQPYALDKHSLFEILAFLDKVKLTVLPVVDKEFNFLGSIIISDLLFHTIELFGLGQKGAVLTISVKKQDFSVAQIGQIVEANGLKIISLFTYPSGSDKIKIIIKVNSQDIISLIHTFERYDYEVENILFDDEKYRRLYQERLEAFLNYLSI